MDAVTTSLASAAIEPALEPVRQLAGKALGGATRLAGKIAAANAGMVSQSAAPLATGSWFTDAFRRFDRDVLREHVTEPVLDELHRFERSTLRPGAEWLRDHPCETTKTALFLAFGAGDPSTVLLPCPPQAAAAMRSQINWWRWGAIGLGVAGILWATRKGA